MTLEIEITIIKEDEYDLVAQMIRDTIRDSWGNIFSKELIEQYYKKYSNNNFREDAKEITYFIAKVKNKIVGVVGLKENTLENFFVDYSFQRKGVGKKLYQSVEGFAKKQGIKSISLEANQKAENIYKKFGFEKVKIVYKEKAGIKYHNIVMLKGI